MKRNREDEEVDRAVALSLASVADQRAAYRAAETQQHEEELSCAVAASLAEVDPEPVCRAPGEWDCLRCTRTNPADAGRCASCESDRMAPFASARPAAVTEVRCGLAGCSRLKAVRDYCCLEHENRALGRRMAAPTDAGVDQVIYGASGDHAYHHLTRRDPTREGVCRRFLDHWEKDAPGAAGFVATPRVERVFRIMPSPLLREAHAAYSLAVGNPRTRYHGTGARCDFGIDQNAWPCADARCALCAIAARGFRLEHSGSGPNAARVAFGTATGLRYGRGLCAHRTIEPRSAPNRTLGGLVMRFVCATLADFSATSGKSHDYAGGSERVRSGPTGSRRWRTMFVASVAAGKAFCDLQGELDVERPPAGYDSVVGETKAKGGSLNYDELVVYAEEAALPVHLIVYSLPE